MNSSPDNESTRAHDQSVALVETNEESSNAISSINRAREYSIDIQKYQPATNPSENILILGYAGSGKTAYLYNLFHEAFINGIEDGYHFRNIREEYSNYILNVKLDNWGATRRGDLWITDMCELFYNDDYRGKISSWDISGEDFERAYKEPNTMSDDDKKAFDKLKRDVADCKGIIFLFPYSMKEVGFDSLIPHILIDILNKRTQSGKPILAMAITKFDRIAQSVDDDRIMIGNKDNSQIFGQESNLQNGNSRRLNPSFYEDMSIGQLWCYRIHATSHNSSMYKPAERDKAISLIDGIINKKLKVDKELKRSILTNSIPPQLFRIYDKENITEDDEELKSQNNDKENDNDRVNSGKTANNRRRNPRFNIEFFTVSAWGREPKYMYNEKEVRYDLEEGKYCVVGTEQHLSEAEGLKVKAFISESEIRPCNILDPIKWVAESYEENMKDDHQNKMKVELNQNIRRKEAGRRHRKNKSTRFVLAIVFFTLFVLPLLFFFNTGLIDLYTSEIDADELGRKIASQPIYHPFFWKIADLKYKREKWHNKQAAFNISYLTVAEKPSFLSSFNTYRELISNSEVAVLSRFHLIQLFQLKPQWKNRLHELEVQFLEEITTATNNADNGIDKLKIIESRVLEFPENENRRDILASIEYNKMRRILLSYFKNSIDVDARDLTEAIKKCTESSAMYNAEWKKRFNGEITPLLESLLKEQETLVIEDRVERFRHMNLFIDPIDSYGWWSRKMIELFCESLEEKQYDLACDLLRLNPLPDDIAVTSHNVLIKAVDKPGYCDGIKSSSSESDVSVPIMNDYGKQMDFLKFLNRLLLTMPEIENVDKIVRDIEYGQARLALLSYFLGKAQVKTEDLKVSFELTKKDSNKRREDWHRRLSSEINDLLSMIIKHQKSLSLSDRFTQFKHLYGYIGVSPTQSSWYDYSRDLYDELILDKQYQAAYFILENTGFPVDIAMALQKKHQKILLKENTDSAN